MRYSKLKGDVPDANQADNPLSLVMDQDRTVMGCFKEPEPEVSETIPCSVIPTTLLLATIVSAAIITPPRKRKDKTSSGDTDTIAR